MSTKAASPAIVQALHDSFDQFLGEWSPPEQGIKVSLLDAVFAYRLLLGRNPDANVEMPHLAEVAQVRTLREFLADLRDSGEFKGQVGLVPSGHALMAELSDFRFWFNTTDSEMGMRMGLGLYEPETVQFFRDIIMPGMVCWDIGAQTGFFSCLFATLSGPGGRVHAYEPMPQSYAMILRNIRENGLEARVTIKNMACSDAKGAVPMTQASGMFVVDHESSDARQIACVRLDQEGLRAPDLIKIDVEGHEPAVLRGLEGVLKGASPQLVIELNEYWLKTNSGTSSAEVVKDLNERGYSVSLIESPTTVLDWRRLHPGPLGNINVLARRAS